MRRHALPQFCAATINRVAWIVLAILMLAASQVHADAGKSPKYVFLFIGDGLAMAQRSAAEYYLAAKDGKPEPGIVKLTMNQMPVQGMTTTYSLNSIITDSGAAGTALATGVKTYNGAISVDGTKKPVPTMAEKARDKGSKVGVVSSVSLDHATPACFYSHQASRNNYYEIALDAAKSGVNSVHMVSKQDTGQLQTFRVIGLPAANTIRVSPSIVSGQGATKPEPEE